VSARAHAHTHTHSHARAHARNRTCTSCPSVAPNATVIAPTISSACVSAALDATESAACAQGRDEEAGLQCQQSSRAPCRVSARRTGCDGVRRLRWSRGRETQSWAGSLRAVEPPPAEQGLLPPAGPPLGSQPQQQPGLAITTHPPGTARARSAPPSRASARSPRSCRRAPRCLRHRRARSDPMAAHPPHGAATACRLYRGALLGEPPCQATQRASLPMCRQARARHLNATAQLPAVLQATA
jgi:hypothetical protein